MIAAFSKLAAEGNEISLVCVGDGPSREELELLCEELHVDGRVHFVGWVNTEIRRNKYLVPYLSIVRRLRCAVNLLEG